MHVIGLFKIHRCPAQLLLAFGLLAITCPALAQVADIIFTGKHIITVDKATAGASAVAVKDDRILAVGKREAVLKHRSSSTRMVDLGDQAMLPAFIDAHGHISVQARLLTFANLSPPPVGTVRNIKDIQDALRRFMRDSKIPPGGWVIGFGYDDSLLAEGRHPDRDELDAVSTDHPIFLLHASGHLGVANSMALAAVGISAKTPNPAGGMIHRRTNSMEPNGVLEESAVWKVYSALPQPSQEESIQQIVAAEHYYASKGIATAQDGAASSKDIANFKAAAKQGKLFLDIVSYALWTPGKSAMPAPELFTGYDNRFRVGAIKLVLDGSPQGKTAYLSKPYYVPPPGKDKDYRGYPAYPPEVVDQAVYDVLSHHIQLAAHANGDAAAQMLIDAVDKARQSLPLTDPRVVMIHAQTVRDDQLDRMASLGIMPSFFSAHTFFWGDWHRESALGPARADRISPTHSALERGIIFTVHNDAPVTPPIPIDLIWSTTSRRTRSGDILGPLQRVSTYEAIKTVTINGAYQYFEEGSKGSITPGKLADLVILSQDPLTMNHENLREIKVIETYSHGRRVYASGK